MKAVLLFIIRCYQRFISPLKPPTCRFYPSCSHYGLGAITRFGVFKGSWLTVKRLCKCHPFHPGGVDLLPEKNQVKQKKTETR